MGAGAGTSSEADSKKTAKQRELYEQKDAQSRDPAPLKARSENSRRGEHDYEQRDRYHQSQRRLSAGYDVGRKHHEITGDVSRKQTIQSEKANDIDASSNKGQNQWKQHNARRAADRRNRHIDTPPNRSRWNLGIHSEANLTNRRPIR